MYSIPLLSSWNDFNKELQMPTAMLHLCLSVSVKMQFQGALRNCGASDMGSTATHLKDTSQFFCLMRYRRVCKHHDSNSKHASAKVTSTGKSSNPRLRPATMEAEQGVGWLLLLRSKLCGVSQWCLSHSTANLLQFGHFYMKPFAQMWYAFGMLCDIDWHWPNRELLKS